MDWWLDLTCTQATDPKFYNSHLAPSKAQRNGVCQVLDYGLQDAWFQISISPSSAVWMFSRTHCSLLVLGLYRAPKGHRLTSYSFRSVFAAWKPHKEVRPNPNITNNRTFQCFLLGSGLFRGSAGGGAVGRPFPAFLGGLAISTQHSCHIFLGFHGQHVTACPHD